MMLELKSIKVIHLLMTTRQALRQLHCLSASGIWTPAQGPRYLRLVWLETGLGMPSERKDSACMMLTKHVWREALVLQQVNTVVSPACTTLTKNVCRGSLGDNTSEALVPLQVNTVCCTAI